LGRNTHRPTPQQGRGPQRARRNSLRGEGRGAEGAGAAGECGVGREKRGPREEEPGEEGAERGGAKIDEGNAPCGLPTRTTHLNY